MTALWVIVPAGAPILRDLGDGIGDEGRCGNQEIAAAVRRRAGL
jgi:hypothetical protein